MASDMPTLTPLEDNLLEILEITFAEEGPSKGAAQFGLSLQQLITEVYYNNYFRKTVVPLVKVLQMHNAKLKQMHLNLNWLQANAGITEEQSEKLSDAIEAHRYIVFAVDQCISKLTRKELQRATDTEAE
eukprot:2285476-Rhodomonas_salina.1